MTPDASRLIYHLAPTRVLLLRRRIPAHVHGWLFHPYLPRFSAFEIDKPDYTETLPAEQWLRLQPCQANLTHNFSSTIRVRL
jgi:hypothetical protein